MGGNIMEEASGNDILPDMNDESSYASITWEKEFFSQRDQHIQNP